MFARFAGIGYIYAMGMRRFNLTERSHVAVELITYGPSDLERRCLVIKQIVEDGDFMLEEALSIYQIDRNEFNKYFLHGL